MNIPFKTVKDWILIAPFGDHQHQFGIQRIDLEAVSLMADRFNSFIGRLGRFFNGVQVFEGHPDTDPEKYPSTRSFGLVKELRVQDDGLWARVEWTPEGKAMLQNGAYQFVSPVWNAREIARVNGRAIYRPEVLESLGLTNLPNLPLPPLANTQPQMKKLTDILNLADEATADEICAAAERLANQRSALVEISSLLEIPQDAPFPDLRAQLEATLANASADKQRADNLAAQFTALQNDSENLRKSVQSVDEQLATLQKQLSAQSSALSAVQSDLDAERAARIELILASAIERNQIPKSDTDSWRQKLTDNIDAALAELANQKTALPTDSQTKNLGNQRGQFDTAANRAAFITNYIANKTGAGLSYDEAWLAMRKEHPNLFSKN